MKAVHINKIKIIIPVFFTIALIITCGCMQNEANAGTGNGSPGGPGAGSDLASAQGGEMGPGPAAGPSFREGYYGNNLSLYISEELDKYPVGELTGTEKADILYIAEEEKIGRDLSLMYFDIWGMRSFLNAAGSGQADLDSMEILMERYGLENPVRDERGMFTNTSLQELYTGMVSSGSATAQDALNNSVTVEEMQIKSLDDAMAATDKEDLKFVYENLRRSSENNLQDFLWSAVNITERYMGPGPVTIPGIEANETSA
ncbi:DUF2202 domain-containing protein [Methanolacinia petrolearia]|uniref:DUF2202 domain-containing protein n=1 Tax=Methanolacinia petrolearia TaxID=54120 RepID=UPI003BAD6F81